MDNDTPIQSPPKVLLLPEGKKIDIKRALQNASFTNSIPNIPCLLCNGVLVMVLGNREEKYSVTRILFDHLYMKKRNVTQL